jgi:hypothetical protein
MLHGAYTWAIFFFEMCVVNAFGMRLQEGILINALIHVNAVYKCVSITFIKFYVYMLIGNTNNNVMHNMPRYCGTGGYISSNMVTIYILKLYVNAILG